MNFQGVNKITVTQDVVAKSHDIRNVDHTMQCVFLLLVGKWREIQET